MVEAETEPANFANIALGESVLAGLLLDSKKGVRICYYRLLTSLLRFPEVRRALEDMAWEAMSQVLLVDPLGPELLELAEAYFGGLLPRLNSLSEADLQLFYQTVLRVLEQPGPATVRIAISLYIRQPSPLLLERIAALPELSVTPEPRLFDFLREAIFDFPEHDPLVARLLPLAVAADLTWAKEAVVAPLVALLGEDLERASSILQRLLAFPNSNTYLPDIGSLIGHNPRKRSPPPE